MATEERAARAKAAALAATALVRETHLAIGHRYGGKVRDVYSTASKVAIVTTDRLSAFERCWPACPSRVPC